MDEIRDNRSMIWKLMIIVYCELLHQNSLSLLEVLGWLIDVNLAIVYVPTNFLIKKNNQNYCNFVCSTTKYSNI